MPAASLKFLMPKTCRSNSFGLQVFHAPAMGAGPEGGSRPARALP